MYGHIVATHCLIKKYQYRIWITIGCNNINYTAPTTTPTTNLNITKFFLNRVISTKNALFITLDITDFYLHSPLSTHEYMFLQYKTIPDCIKLHYNLHRNFTKDKLHIHVKNGMYGLPQAGHLSHDPL
jgi:hypothetical protein